VTQEEGLTLDIEDDATQIFTLLRTQPKELKAFADTFSLISANGLWTLLTREAQHELIVVLLGATLQAGRTSASPKAIGVSTATSSGYLRQAFAIRTKVDDSNDAIVLRHLRGDEKTVLPRTLAARNTCEYKASILTSWPKSTLLVVAGYGLVLVEHEEVTQMAYVTTTAVELRLAELETFTSDKASTRYIQLALKASTDDARSTSFQALARHLAVAAGDTLLISHLTSARGCAPPSG
jgi:hypothetical protein